MNQYLPPGKCEFISVPQRPLSFSFGQGNGESCKESYARGGLGKSNIVPPAPPIFYELLCLLPPPLPFSRHFAKKEPLQRREWVYNLTGI